MAEIANAVVRVGDGRGFVVEGAKGQRFIIAAAHLLPDLPPCPPGERAGHPINFVGHTYKGALG
jgi:hypothetical protein